MTNAELIKALRCEVDCSDCAYYHDNRCDEWGMRCDAADALEAAEEICICKDEKIAYCIAVVDALEDSNDAYIEENERLKKRIAELEAQLPKQDRGVCMTAIGTLYVPNYDD